MIKVLAIYHGEISLKEAEFKQKKKIEKRIQELKFNYIPKNEKEEEMNGVLMQANELFKYRNKIINAFKNGILLSEHLKITDNAAYG